MSGYDVKFSNKYPLRGINKRPIMPTKEVKEMAVAYQQATKVGKASNDAAVKNAEGEYVAFSSNMAEVLPSVAKELKEKEEQEQPGGDDGDVPIYDSNTNVFLANGVPIVIKDTEDGVGALITWDGGEQVVSSGTIVIGGGSDKDYPSSSITIEGGDLSAKYTNVFGGGMSRNVDDANITVHGGKIYSIFGGGRLSSVVKNVNIDVTGGEIGQLSGGGAAYVSASENVGDMNDIENSPCRVENAVINISGGTVYSANNNYGLLYGGGQSYSYTGNVTLNISGSVDLSKTCYVTAGGANGMTGHATVMIDGEPNIYLLQSGNRGVIGTVELIVNGGTIESMYAGGEEANNVDPVYNGPDPSISVSITGGNITTLKTGKNGKAVIAPDSTVINATYSAAATIVNLEEAKALFGTSLVEEA